MVSDRRTWQGHDDGFSALLEHARASGRPLLDLTESDPGRCGLAWDSAELGSILGASSAGAQAPDALPRAREAVASYLAGRGVSIAPDRIRFARSRSSAHRLLLSALCGAGDEVLVASPSRPLTAAIPAQGSVRPYALSYDGEWRLDRRSLARTVTRRARAILVGNPSEPTGAMLRREDLAFLDEICADRGIALVGDEAFADTAAVPCASVLQATRCLAFQISGLSGVCGLPRLQVEWWAASGPDEAVETASSRLERAGADESVPGSALLALPPLLARREQFLARLRKRLAENRASLAAAALRESPWSLSRGRGGCWAVLEIGAAEHEEALCLALLEDGVAVRPGSSCGLPASGYLVVSLLPTPDVFGEALSRLDRRLRAPL
jgi:alanine-synthesizing transaminase